jgi:hypothetical protein
MRVPAWCPALPAGAFGVTGEDVPPPFPGNEKNLRTDRDSEAASGGGRRLAFRKEQSVALGAVPEIMSKRSALEMYGYRVCFFVAEP